VRGQGGVAALRIKYSEIPVVKELEEWWEIPAGCYGHWVIHQVIEGEVEETNRRGSETCGCVKIRAKTPEAIVVRYYRSYERNVITGVYRLVRDP